MNAAQFLAVCLALAGLGVLLVVILLRVGRRPEAELLPRISELGSNLTNGFAKASADMAARVEQIKGDLRGELTDRIQQGLGGVRETLDRQLAEGRAEQAGRLRETVTALETKFDGLRSATEGRLEQAAERQGASLRDARAELAQGLATLAAGLHEKFDQMNAAHAGLARQGRDELARSLGETTQALQQRFEGLEQKTALSLEAIRANVDTRLQGLGAQVQQKLEQNIQEGFAHFQKVQDHLRAAEEQLRNVGVVGQSINELNSLLKLPHLRGRFGEAALGRLLADFLPAQAFEEQVPVVADSREKVDAVVKFPNRRLPIDSKFNREAVLPLFEGNDPARLEEARRQLAVAVKQQARDIAAKYIHPEHGTTDLALMFLPSETLYFEIIRDTELCETLHKLKVFPVSPNTLAITLCTIAMSIQQYEFAKNVQQTLAEIRQAQRSFGHFQKKFDDLGKGLQKAQQAYETATGHLNRYTQRVVALTGEPPPELPADLGEGSDQLELGASPPEAAS